MLWPSRCLPLARASARAELPSIRFDRLQPLGLAAGGSVEVEINGGDLEGLSALRFDQPGLSAEPIAGKERWFKITAAADVPAGTYDVRARRPVRRQQLEAARRPARPDRSARNRAQQRARAVAGRAGQLRRSTARPMARTSISTASPPKPASGSCWMSMPRSSIRCSIRSCWCSIATGKQLASSGDYHGRDPLIDFVAPADGEYIAVLHDLSYRGGYPYRLTISDRPHVENVFPRRSSAGRRRN